MAIVKGKLDEEEEEDDDDNVVVGTMYCILCGWN
jgi:hypothetical protein